MAVEFNFSILLSLNPIFVSISYSDKNNKMKKQIIIIDKRITIDNLCISIQALVQIQYHLNEKSPIIRIIHENKRYFKFFKSK